MIALLLAGCTPELLVPHVPISTLDADFSWHLEFDAAAQAAGYETCDYTRHYDGEEDQSVPWLCPDCDEVWRATVAMPTEEQSCYNQLGSGTPDPVEWLGVGEGDWWRGAENWRLAQSTGLSDDGTAFTIGYTTEWNALSEFPEGQYRLSVEGSGVRATEMGDPFHGYAPPPSYTCGWPNRHAPPFEGSYSFVVGNIVPDGLFLDRCDEGVSLHDFGGYWLVIDISAMDCGPCQEMAAEEAAFLARVGSGVQVVTLLVPALQDPLGVTTRSHIDTWSDTFDLDTPVLRDRGWGFWMGFAAFPNTFGYPMTLVVGPDGRIRAQWVGYGGWDDVERVIGEG